MIAKFRPDIRIFTTVGARIIVPLFVIVSINFVAVPRPALKDRAELRLVDPTFAVLGPEAPAILHILIGEAHYIVVQPGMLDCVLHEQHIQVLIIPQDWAYENDLKIAQASGVRIVTL